MICFGEFSGLSQSGRLPGEGEGEKLPKGGDDKQPAEIPSGKLVVHCIKVSFCLLLM